MPKNSYDDVRRSVLRYEGNFRVFELLKYLRELGYGDKSIIADVLRELMDSRLVQIVGIEDELLVLRSTIS